MPCRRNVITLCRILKVEGKSKLFNNYWKCSCASLCAAFFASILFSKKSPVSMEQTSYFFATGHEQNQDLTLLVFPARCARFRCVLCDLFALSRCSRPLQYFFITRRDDFCLGCWVRSTPRLTDGFSLIPCRRGFSWASHYLHYWTGLFFTSGFCWHAFQR